MPQLDPVPCHSSPECVGIWGELGSGSCKGSTAPLCSCNRGCFCSMTCWSISSCARAVVALSHVLALLQVRNAIQRMKDKKKALSFTVSWKESLLPLHPSATHQRRVPAVPWDCFEEMMMERNLIILFLSPFFAVLLDNTDSKIACPH